MAAGVSKNQRVAKKADAPASSTGVQQVIVPLNGGRNAYVRVAGKTRHVKTDSDAFVEAAREAGPEKVAAELEYLQAAFPAGGWDRAKARLVDAGVV